MELGARFSNTHSIVFALLGVIIKAKNQFVEKVTIAEPYFIINPCKNKKSKKPHSEYTFP